MTISHRQAFVPFKPNADAAEQKREIAAYLPDNYSVRYAEGGFLLLGEDVAGWTLDGYVIPRLASGLIFAKEVSR